MMNVDFPSLIYILIIGFFFLIFSLKHKRKKQKSTNSFSIEKKKFEKEDGEQKKRLLKTELPKICKVNPLVQDRSVFFDEDKKDDAQKEGLEALLQKKNLKDLFIVSELLNKKKF